MALRNAVPVAGRPRPVGGRPRDRDAACVRRTDCR